MRIQIILGIGVGLAGLIFLFLTAWMGYPLLALMWNDHSPKWYSIVLGIGFTAMFAAIAFLCLREAGRMLSHLR